jgi:acyl CoA:acetate/3-ketoacid CoA transferase beta subunit
VRPIPIHEADVWEGGRRIVYAAPNGSLTDDHIRPVEAIVDRLTTTGGKRVCVKVQLEEGDLDKLTAGGHVWLSMYGGLVPFCFDVKAPGE